MARIVLTLAEWKRISHELSGTHCAAPPAGLIERLHALFAQAPHAWQDQPFAVELDDSSIEAVWAVQERLTTTEHMDAQRDGVAAAMRIVHHHQQRPDSSPPTDREKS